MRPAVSLDTRRRSGNRSKVPKFIIVSEGYRTEIQYFKGLAENRRIAKISSLIQICPLNRFASHSGHSDPMAMLDLLDEYIEHSKTGKLTQNLFVNMFIEHVWDHLNELPCTDIDELRQAMVYELNEKGQESIKDVKIATKICSNALIKRSIKVSLDFAPELPISYDPEIDKIYVMIDRDRDSRNASKCNDFISRCREHGYVPLLTNPCFEFWLLLHFEDVICVDKKELYANEKVDGKRFTERKLDEFLMGIGSENGYDKTNFDAWCFVYRIDEAIKNEKLFCCEEKCIMSNLGSNIGSLIQEMRAPQIRK